MGGEGGELFFFGCRYVVQHHMRTGFRTGIFVLLGGAGAFSSTDGIPGCPGVDALQGLTCETCNFALVTGTPIESRYGPGMTLCTACNLSPHEEGTEHYGQRLSFERSLQWNERNSASTGTNPQWGCDKRVLQQAE